MLVVRIELHSAITGEVTEIGQMIICNDGTSRDPRVGNYDVRLGRRDVADIHKNYHDPLRQGSVVGHRRLSRPIWDLLAKALSSVGFVDRRRKKK